MTPEKQAITDSSLARMAGNIAAGLAQRSDTHPQHDSAWIAFTAVQLARQIVAEIEAPSWVENEKVIEGERTP